MMSLRVLISAMRSSFSGSEAACVFNEVVLRDLQTWVCALLRGIAYLY